MDKRIVVGGIAIGGIALLFLTHNKGKATAAQGTASGTSTSQQFLVNSVPGGSQADPNTAVYNAIAMNQGLTYPGIAPGSIYPNSTTPTVMDGTTYAAHSLTPTTNEAANGTVQIGPGMAVIRNGQGSQYTYEPIAPPSTQQFVI